MFQEKILKFLEQHLGSYRITKKNHYQYAFFCPNCHHRKRKFEINVDNPQKPLMHCWVCNYSSHSYAHFFSTFFSVDTLKTFKKECIEFDSNKPSLITFKETIAALMQNKKKDNINLQTITLPQEYQCLNNANNLEMLNAKYYLTKRNVFDKDIKNFFIGFCADGQYKDRIIFPSFREDGNLDFFTGRSINKRKPKYKCSTEKLSVIYNELNLNFSKPLLITEGPFDVISANKVFENCTCLLGKTLNTKSKLFNKILQYKTPIYLALDRDTKKINDLFKIIKLLVSHNIGVLVLNIEKNKDLGEMKTQEIKWLIENAKKYDVENYFSFVKIALQ